MPVLVKNLCPSTPLHNARSLCEVRAATSHVTTTAAGHNFPPEDQFHWQESLMSRDAISPRGPDAASEVSRAGTLDELMEKIQIRIEPEVRFKIQKTLGELKGSLNVSTFPLPLHSSDKPGIKPALVIKPSAEASAGWYHLRKFEISPTEKAVKIFSNKIKVGPMALQFSAGHNWGTGRVGLAYRARFFGPLGFASHGQKREFKLGNRITARTTFLADVSLPDVEGRLSNGDEERYTRMDVGSISVEVPKVDLVVNLDEPKPKPAVVVQTTCPSCAGAGVV